MTEIDTRRQAFATYVLPEIDLLYRVARSLTEQPADAEDLVQETLLHAYRNVDRFDGQHPRAWLLTTLRNAERNRHRGQRPMLFLDTGTAEEDHQPPGAGVPSPEELVVGATFDAEVQQAFDALPDKLRSVVHLVDVAGLSYAEAAATLGVPVGTVMSRLHRGRRWIRRRLTGIVPRRGESA
ncbi:RNA polymerase sigma factor [Longimycelium tulufanense]|uniref:RNA polymerase sigma factor n=1 Tax=Longimycelium tulufanense TaxID=907463 RepID=A0A8J3CGC1_9PSEU|nr:sigma-70 family RNA polymerase sigma factor [Longimycelium tulufanense]GGM62909.1 RNA polymerase sigma factor [Longimycelium tulufanense]